MRIILLLTLLGVSAIPALGADPIAFFVTMPGAESPGAPGQTFHSPVEAQRAVRALKQAGPGGQPIMVNICGGTYAITEPLVLGPEDSGTKEAPITWRAWQEEKPVISGGRAIGGWKKESEALWVADLPEVREGGWDFVQLYVNGTLCRRARIPNEGFLRVAGFPDGGNEVNYHTDCRRFEYKPGDLNPAWYNLNQVEVIVYYFWTDSHLLIQSLDEQKHIVTFDRMAGKVFTDDFSKEGARYIVENVREGLDQPGEWYLDKPAGKLYYIPRADEDMVSAEVIAPAARAFIQIRGDAQARRYVEYLYFKGLSFQYTNWRLPPGNSNDGQGSSSVPAAVTLTGARHCSFERCVFSRLGTFALDIGAGCRDNMIVGNQMTELAAGGIRVNGGNGNSHPLERTGATAITNNRIGPYGLVYPSAVGVLLMNTDDNHVAYNEIHHGYYTGVSAGWSWGYQRSVSRDNKIEFNHIHHIGQGLLSDMGGIYTLGVSPGTTIRNNLIHDIDANRYGGWGIYNDEGSTHILIENNVVYNTKFSAYNIHYAKEITVRNNIFAPGRLEQLSRGRVEPHQSCYFENNIIYWKEGELFSSNWKDKPYTFYFNPSDPDGREQTSTFVCDWNLYYNPGLTALDQVKFNGDTLEQWRKRGKDVHSLFADPKFKDPDNGDFTLAEDSPVWALGFQPIDVSKAGPMK